MCRGGTEQCAAALEGGAHLHDEPLALLGTGRGHLRLGQVRQGKGGRHLAWDVNWGRAWVHSHVQGSQRVEKRVAGGGVVSDAPTGPRACW